MSKFIYIITYRSSSDHANVVTFFGSAVGCDGNVSVECHVINYQFPFDAHLVLFEVYTQHSWEKMT